MEKPSKNKSKILIILKEKKNENELVIDQSNYHMIRKTWESRNFMELNNWCQITQCKLQIEQTELKDKTFLTKISLLDENKILKRKVTGQGKGRNKKESKNNAMREIMESLMDFNLIHLGIKDRKFISEYYQLVKNEDVNEIIKENDNNYSEEKEVFSSNKSILEPTSTKDLEENEEIDNKILPSDVLNMLKEKETNTVIKKLVKEIKTGKFEDCCEYLEYIKKRKTIEWYEFSFLWYYALNEGKLKYVRKLLDIIQPTNTYIEQNKSNEFLRVLLNSLTNSNKNNDKDNSANISTDLSNSICNISQNENKDNDSSKSNSLPLLFIEELYTSLLYLKDLEFALTLSKEIYSFVNYDENEFLSKEASLYFREKRQIYFLEIVDSINQAQIKCMNNDDKDNFVNVSIFGKLDKIGNRFAQEVVNFIPQDKKQAEMKIIKKGNFNSKDNYSLISENEVVLLTNEKVSLLGYIKEIDCNFNCKLIILPDKINYITSEVFIMTKLTNYTTFEKTLEGLKIFTTKDCCSPLIHKIIFDNSKDDTRSNIDLNQLASTNITNLDLNKMVIENQHLNSSQQDALRKASNLSLTLIQGPPGTGKTTLGIEIVLEWLRYDPGSSILVCADSNIAVDILYRELNRAGVSAVRMGLKDEDFNEKRNKYGQMKKLLRSVQVVCSTCVGSLSEYMTDLQFTRVLIDEATQATEMSTILPLTKMAQQVVLIGDHKQLPPTIISFNANRQGLSISLFERLVNIGIKPLMLNSQYRMHSSISHFPSKFFYDSLLQNGICDSSRPPIAGFPWPNKEFRVCFVDVPGNEEADGSSFINNLETSTILDILFKIFNYNTLLISEVGVITPYDAQKRKLKFEIHSILKKFPQLFNIKNPDDLSKSIICSVNTVDGFQGMDKDLIIFSAVRSNDKGRVGFLKDPRRLNVMLTRAKRGLIVVGNYKCLIKDDMWKEWLNWMEMNSALFK